MEKKEIETGGYWGLDSEDDKKIESEDVYWGSSAHKGFNFDEDGQFTAGESKLSTQMRKDGLNQFDLLKCDGLTEIVENRSTKDFSTFNISPVETKQCALKLDKSCNPLTINQKKQIDGKRCRPEDTVKSMILGSEYSLSRFKGKIEKLELLNAAVKCHDGNTILEVILFLRDTLKKSIFQREIMAYPDAVNVYLSYLEEDHESDELANMLLLLNRAEETAVLKYEAVVCVEHPETKLNLIENRLSTYFQFGVADIVLRQSVEEHKQILEEQIKLEKYNQMCPTNDSECLSHFEKLTGKKSVVDSSVLCSLIFCCLNSYNSSEHNFANPEKIKTNYNLSKKQYTWAMLRALATTNRWSCVEDLFMSKNWLGGTKMRSCIAYSRILEVLSKAKAPDEVLKKYVSCIENEKEKLILAKKYSCHSIVIEVYKNNKDRAKLMEYKASLLPQSVDFCNATEILKNPNIRWKN